jgi:predicted transcriptional regulator
MNEHAKRVLKSIEEGNNQKSKIIKSTCLSPKTVIDCLRELRKMKVVAEKEGLYVKI